MENYLFLLLKTLLGYLVFFILMKFMGKREIGQLSLFDLIIILSISDIMVFGIENYDKNIFFALLPMIMVALIQRLFAVLSLKFAFFRKIADGTESIIIYNGTVFYDEMKKQRYNMDDLYSELRQKNINSINLVGVAVLEANGKLSVFKKSEISTYFPVPVIVSGKINEMVLKTLNLDHEWVNKQLMTNNILLKDVLSAVLKKDELVFITKK